jgi:hypothetical protein
VPRLSAPLLRGGVATGFQFDMSSGNVNPGVVKVFGIVN